MNATLHRDTDVPPRSDRADDPFGRRQTASATSDDRRGFVRESFVPAPRHLATRLEIRRLRRAPVVG
jgi:hypothetical protein